MSEFRRRLMMAAAMQQSGGGDDMGYVKDGLVFHLDCFDAKPSPNGNNWQWIDRASSIAFDMYNVSKKNSNGGLILDGRGYGKSLTDDRFALSNATIESVFFLEKSQPQFYTRLFTQKYGNTIALILSFQDSTIDIGTLSSYRFAIHRDLFTEKNVILSANETAININNIDYTYNRASINSVSPNMMVGSKDSKNQNMKGVIYAIRIYNRKLTKGEMLQNQQVDIDRFFGGIAP